MKLKHLSLFALAIVMVGCPKKGPLEGYRCFDVNDSAFVGKTGAYSELSKQSIGMEELVLRRSDNDQFGVTTQALSAVREYLWKKKEIPVCWEPAGWIETDQGKRDIVRMAIENTWEDALYIDDNSYVRFTGWGKCARFSTGIRILVSDEGPHAKGLGTYIEGMKNGVVLNFTFKNWSSGCMETAFDKRTNLDCIYSIAVHEFGHVLGIAHEQNRPDTDHLSCPESERQGSNGTTHIGPWDTDSVMNYCNRYWNNNGQLSNLDHLMIRNLYFPNGSEVKCVSQKKFDDVVNRY